MRPSCDSVVAAGCMEQPVIVVLVAFVQSGTVDPRISFVPGRTLVTVSFAQDGSAISEHPPQLVRFQRFHIRRLQSTCSSAA